MVVLVSDVPWKGVAGAIAARASPQQWKEGPDQTRGCPWVTPTLPVRLAAGSGCTMVAGLFEIAGMHPAGSLDPHLKGMRSVSPGESPAAHLDAASSATHKGPSPLDRLCVKENRSGGSGERGLSGHAARIKVGVFYGTAELAEAKWGKDVPSAKQHKSKHLKGLSFESPGASPAAHLKATFSVTFNLNKCLHEAIRDLRVAGIC
jgi:hypothetical protein